MKGLMLALKGWSSSTVSVDVAGAGVEVFTPAADVQTPRALLNELAAWIADAGRGWAASVAACDGDVVELGNRLAADLSLTQVADDTLDAPFSGGTLYRAAAFDVVAAQPITITGIRHRAGQTGTQAIRVWRRSGSGVGYTSSSSGWTLVQSTSQTLTAGALHTITLDTPVTVPAGITGWYIDTAVATSPIPLLGVTASPATYSDAQVSVTSHAVTAVNFGATDSTRHCEIGVEYTYEYEGSFDTLTPAGPAATYLPALDGTAPAVGGFYVDVDSYGWSRWDKSDGGIAGSGYAWSQGATPAAPRRPNVQMTLEPAEVYALERATRYTPRLASYAQVWDPHTAAWRTVTYGRLSWDPSHDLTRVTVECLAAPGA